MKYIDHPSFKDQNPAHRGKLVADLIESIACARTSCCVVEIGSIRNATKEYHDGDGHSTVYIAQAAQRTPGLHFSTVDLEVEVCQKVIGEAGLGAYVDIVQSDGIEYLEHTWTENVDFLYLDGPDDADWTVKAFRESLRVMKKDGFVAFDDFEDIDDVDQKIDAEKGRLLLPMLKNAGVPFHRLGKKVVVLSLQEVKGCMPSLPS